MSYSIRCLIKSIHNLTFKVICFIIIFIYSYNSKSQTYYNYYKSINLAEKYILKSDANSALIQYRLALNKKKGFAKDYYNSAICAFKLNKKRECFKYLLKLADKGLNINFLNSKYNFNFKFKGTSWNRFERKYVKKFNYFYSKNKDVRHKLDSLALIDQFFRKRDNAYEMYRDTIEKIDSSNVKCLIKITEKIGYFPDENVYGLKDTITFSPTYYLIIWHQADKSKKNFDFSQIIKNAIQNGKIEPNNAALLMQINGTNIRNFQDIVYKVQFKKDFLLDEDCRLKNNQYLYKDWLMKKKGMDDFRLSFGLCSIEEYVAKANYFINIKSQFIFFNQITFPTYETEDIETANSLLKEGKVLTKFSFK